MRVLLGSLFLLASLGAAYGQVSQDASVSPAEVVARDLADRLKSGEEPVVTAALIEVRTALESDPDGTYGYLRKYWLEALESGSHSAQAEKLALDAILLSPWRVADVEALQERRARIALRGGNPSLALSHARALFNVVLLRNTEHALMVLIECEKAVYGEDPKMLRQLRREQLAGATTRPVDQVEPTSPMVLAIPVDPAPYEARIKQLTSEDEQTAEGKGTLLLLAGRAEEARQLFAKMAAGGGMTFHEGVARAIRAADGTVGRANGYSLAAFTSRNQPTTP